MAKRRRKKWELNPDEKPETREKNRGEKKPRTNKKKPETEEEQESSQEHTREPKQSFGRSSITPSSPESENRISSMGLVCLMKDRQIKEIMHFDPHNRPFFVVFATWITVPPICWAKKGRRHWETTESNEFHHMIAQL